jgi:hypothetical protein
MSATDPYAYDVILSRANGQYVASIPALAIFAKAPSAESALAAVERRRIAVIDEFREQGLLDRLPELRNPAGSGEAPISGFAARVGIVAGAVVSIIIVSVVTLNLVLSYHVNRMASVVSYAYSSLTPGQLSHQLIGQIETVAARMRNLNPLARDKVAADLRTIVREIKPVVDELRPLLNCETMARTQPLNK